MERFEATWVQTDTRYRYGLWGCFDTDDGCYIAYGPKGTMGQLARLLNRDDVTVKLAPYDSDGRWA
jgi:hypothetical protein